MKFTEKVTERYQQVKELPYFRANAGLYLGLVALGRIRKIDGVRGIAPEPFDFFSHNGNILSSVTVALAVSAAVRMRQEHDTPLMKTKMISAALASGAVINALVETRTGLSLPYVECMFVNCSATADPIDFAYGMVGAAGGGAMAVAMSSNSPENSAATHNAFSKET